MKCKQVVVGKKVCLGILIFITKILFVRCNYSIMKYTVNRLIVKQFKWFIWVPGNLLKNNKLSFIY